MPASMVSLNKQLSARIFPFHIASVLIPRQQMGSKLPTLDLTLDADLRSFQAAFILSEVQMKPRLCDCP